MLLCETAQPIKIFLLDFHAPPGYHSARSQAVTRVCGMYPIIIVTHGHGHDGSGFTRLRDTSNQNSRSSGRTGVSRLGGPIRHGRDMDMSMRMSDLDMLNVWIIIYLFLL